MAGAQRTTPLSSDRFPFDDAEDIEWNWETP
jgi:hypothetical protein